MLKRVVEINDALSYQTSIARQIGHMNQCDERNTYKWFFDTKNVLICLNTLLCDNAKSCINNLRLYFAKRDIRLNAEEGVVSVYLFRLFSLRNSLHI
jgi:hypothetical protein